MSFEIVFFDVKFIGYIKEVKVNRKRRRRSRRRVDFRYIYQHCLCTLLSWPCTCFVQLSTQRKYIRSRHLRKTEQKRDYNSRRNATSRVLRESQRADLTSRMTHNDMFMWYHIISAEAPTYPTLQFCLQNDNKFFPSVFFFVFLFCVNLMYRLKIIL